MHHGNALNRAVQQILDLLKIDQSQVVRCLFAGLPPGVTIVIHGAAEVGYPSPVGG